MLTRLFKDMMNSKILEQLFPYQNKSTSNTTSSKRALRHIHLGITNRKIDQLERITVTGRCGLNLISHKTKSMDLDDNALKTVGKILLHLSDNILPSMFPDCNAFSNCENSGNKKYLKMFAKQLLLEEAEHGWIIRYLC